MLPESDRTELLATLTPKQANAFLYDWLFWARPDQIAPPGDWFVWVILAGRGWGKTRTGAEQTRRWVKDCPLVSLIGATADDARDIMIEGESGIMNICPNWDRPKYVKSERRLDWPNGAKSLIFTADEPERLRGKQHQKVWGDEVGSWRYPESWTQAMMGLRLGTAPQAIVTTTPRPIKIIRDLIADTRNIVTRGTTYDNRSNLAPGFFDYVITKYEGTRLGRQELNAELLDDVPGALWQRNQIEALRVMQHPELIRIVVGVDPEATSGEDSAETGIIVAGLGADGYGYILADSSVRDTPGGWARAAVTAYHLYQADRIIGEVNNGGEMVGYTIMTIDPRVAYKAVHASRGKQARAEPVASLYEQGRIKHVGAFPELEDQMCSWTPGDTSPDRLDALVWALTELFLEADEQDGYQVHDDRVEISRY